MLTCASQDLNSQTKWENDVMICLITVTLELVGKSVILSVSLSLSCVFSSEQSKIKLSCYNITNTG